MARIYSSDEIVEFGMQIKKNGRDYYDLASKAVKAAKVRELFEYLSNDEQQNLTVFEGILARLNGNAPPEADDAGAYSAYVAALVEENIFTRNKAGSELARTIRNDKQALDLAFSYEKDAMLFCNEIKRSLRADLHADIEALIAQGQDHFTRISDVMKGFLKFGVGSNRAQGSGQNY